MVADKFQTVVVLDVDAEGVQDSVHGRPGDVAYKCYNCFDPKFQGPQSNSNTNTQPRDTNVFYASLDTCGTSSEWLMDNGATNHITPDQSNLTQKTKYYGGEQLHVGNGQGLEICNVGTSYKL